MVDNTTNADSAGQPLGDDFEKAPNQESAANSANTAAMEQLAHDTGGKAFYTSNNLSQSMNNAIQNGSHYYTLVYTPPSVQPDGRYHKIEVKLTAGKATLSYRRGYYADTVMDAKPASDPLPPLLARELPASTQVLFQARLAPIAAQPAPDAPRAGGNAKLTGPHTRYKVDLVINPSTIALDLAPDLTHNGKIEVAVVAYDQAGKPVNWTGETLGLVSIPTPTRKSREWAFRCIYRSISRPEAFRFRQAYTISRPTRRERSKSLFQHIEPQPQRRTPHPSRDRLNPQSLPHELVLRRYPGPLAMIFALANGSGCRD